MTNMMMQEDRLDIMANIVPYKNCKICGAENIYSVSKIKQLKKPRGTKNIITVKGEQIFCTEEGPYRVWIADEMLDVDNGEYEVNAVKDYVFEQITFRLALVCSTCASYQTNDVDEPYMKGKAYPIDDDFMETKNEFVHYEVVFFVNVDQKVKRITSVNLVSEWLENDDYSINKNYTNNYTQILKKQHGIKLPFVYDKDFKDFDFGKLLAISKLLK